MMRTKEPATAATVTASELPPYIPGQPLESSECLAWNGVFVRKFFNIRGEFVVPGLSEYALVVHLGRAIDLERKLAGRLHKSRVYRGDITIVPTKAPIEWHLGGPADVLHLHLQPSLVAQIGEQVIDTDPSHIEIVDRLAICDPLVQQIGLLLLSELQTGGVLGRLYAESLAHTLAAHLVRYHSTLAQPVLQITGGLPHRKLHCVLDYINDHLDQDVPLAKLAEAVNLSPYHFTRLFKQSTGMAPHQYLIEQRIEMAKRLLVETELSIAEIAYQVGICSQSHLTTLFRKRVGRTPVAYRNSF